jgi:hypothetical protein
MHTHVLITKEIVHCMNNGWKGVFWLCKLFRSETDLQLDLLSVSVILQGSKLWNTFWGKKRKNGAHLQ